jgi:hypothetical protein
MRVERHFAFWMAAEPDALLGHKLLPLAAPRSIDVVDHDASDRIDLRGLPFVWSGRT